MYSTQTVANQGNIAWLKTEEAGDKSGHLQAGSIEGVEIQSNPVNTVEP